MLAGESRTVPGVAGDSGAPFRAIAILTAPSALTSPAPCSKTEKFGRVWAVYIRIPLISEGVSAGFACSIRATMPVTTGAAIDVPFRYMYALLVEPSSRWKVG